VYSIIDATLVKKAIEKGSSSNTSPDFTAGIDELV
jgi:hypothetical protein